MSCKYLKYKYLKYKLKYTNLRKELLGGNPVSIDLIRDLFTKSNLYQISDNRKRNSEEISPPIDEQPIIQTPVRVHRTRNRPEYYGSSNQPSTPSILTALTPDSRSNLEKDFKKDDNKLSEDLALQELKDKDYIDFEGENGKFIEIWIADNMKCPVCGKKTLRRYVSDSMPVIDVVCINGEHNNGVRFFQIKTSNGTLFMRKEYFSKTTRHIFVGSRNYGEPVHSLDGMNDLLIGYICIKYYINSDIVINMKDSFIVLPIIGRCMNSYYNYIPPINKKFIIEYNRETTNVINLQNLLPTNIIETNYERNYDEISNPLSHQL